MLDSKLTKWVSGFIAGGIILSFLYYGIGDVLFQTMRHQHFAKIDGVPISEQKFLEMYTHQIRMLKGISPQATPQELKLARFPEKVLEDFITESVFYQELKSQGFTISKNTLTKKLKKYAKEITEHFDIIHNDRKRSFIEDNRQVFTKQQLLLPYTLPVHYQQLLHQSFYSKRKFDLIELSFNDIKITSKPSEAELKNIEKRYNKELIAPETRSFIMINLNPEFLSISDNQIKEFYEKNKANYKIPTKRHIITIKATDKDTAAKVRLKLNEYIKHTKKIQTFNDLKKFLQKYKLTHDQRISIEDKGWIRKSDLPSKVSEIIFGQKLFTHSDFFEVANQYTSYISVEVKPSYIPDFEEIKNIVKQNAKDTLNQTNIEKIKEKIDQDDIKIEEIAKHYGYKVQHIKDVNRLGLSLNGKLLVASENPKTILEVVFNSEKNEMSDVIDDPVAKRAYIIEVRDIQPEIKMQGEILQTTLRKLWEKETREQEAQRILETLLRAENKPEEFYNTIKEHNLTLRKNLAIDRISNRFPYKSITPELVNRLFSSPKNSVIFVNTEKGIVIARITNDILHKFDEARFLKEKQFYAQGAAESIYHAFTLLAYSRHTIEKNPEVLYKYLTF